MDVSPLCLRSFPAHVTILTRPKALIQSERLLELRTTRACTYEWTTLVNAIYLVVATDQVHVA